jgi:hypothetical protein
MSHPVLRTARKAGLDVISASRHETRTVGRQDDTAEHDGHDDMETA